MRRFDLLLSSAMALALVGASAAQAQTAQPEGGLPAGPTPQVDGAPGVNLIEEVVVTAEKREQSLQDVPVAISAFTDETRDTVGINSVQDLTNFTPGLSYTTNNDRANLRGIGRFTNNRSSEGGVAIYNDGFYTSSTTSAATSSLYLERTEVLRGPQGTLYGRNSIGGAINLISKRPTDEFEGEVRAVIGNYERRDVGAAFSGPITDNIRFRVVGNIDQQEEGYFTNRSGGPSEGGRGDQWQFQGQLEGSFFDDKLEFWARFDTAEWHNIGRGPGGRTSSTTAPYETFPLSISGLNFNSAFVPPGTTPLFNTTRPALQDQWSIDTNRPNYIDLETTTSVLHVTLHMDNFDIRYVGGHTYYDYRLQTDVDGTSRTDPFPITRNTVIGRNATTGQDILATFVPVGQTLLVSPDNFNRYQEEPSWFSNELNIASTNESDFQWIVGLYQFRENSNYTGIDSRYSNQTQFTNPVLAFLGQRGLGTPTSPLIPVTTATVPNPDGSYAFNSSQNVSESYAAYGQIDYQLTDTLKFTGGLRYTFDRKRSEEEARIICFLSPSCTAFGPNGVDFSSQVYNPIVNIRNPIDPSVVIRGGNNAATDVRNQGVINPLDGPFLNNGVQIEPGTGRYTRLLENSWDAITGTAGVDYTPNSDLLFYAKYTRGYKAGGFNAGAIPQYPTTNEETINAYEAGAKATLFGRVQANASVFFYDYRDIQVPLSGIDAATGLNRTEFFNIPKSEVMGFELETIYSPIENLQFLFNYSYLDAEITESQRFVDSDDALALLPTAQPSGEPLRNAAGVITAQPQTLVGRTLPSSTPHRVTINGSYTWDFPIGSLNANATYVWRDDTQSSIFNRRTDLAPAYDQVDARLVFTDIDDRFTVIAFVKNAFDELGNAGADTTRLQTTGQLFQTLSFTAPRTYGLELQYRF